MLRRPHPDAYVVPGTRLSGGPYPGSPPEVSRVERDAKLAGYLDAGVSAFIDLTSPHDRLAPYAERVQELGEERGVVVVHDRLAITDMSVCDADHMHRILDTIDTRLGEGHGVYVHCWGGIGRTGLVVGCWLVRQGHDGESALREVDRLFRTMSPEKIAAHGAWGSPQTDAQRAMVRGWDSVGRRP